MTRMNNDLSSSESPATKSGNANPLVLGCSRLRYLITDRDARNVRHKNHSVERIVALQARFCR
ncbi:MAG: hypothetical protein B7Z55_01460 [Planctomycetales bacterium 12-60-4]|nr:MAG: hypothetical protein B7Z55_01460 [Planctomycetales bacterium 12-60-4]